MLKVIDFDDLGDLDNGMARTVANDEIRKAVQDLIDRGKDDGKARNVAFTLEMYWQQGKVLCHLHAQAKLPPRRTTATACVEKDRQGESCLMFRDDNPENTEQMTFDDVTPKK